MGLHNAGKLPRPVDVGAHYATLIGQSKRSYLITKCHSQQPFSCLSIISSVIEVANYNLALKRHIELLDVLLSSLNIEGILPKGPYLQCVSMAGWALLAGYPRYVWFH